MSKLKEHTESWVEEQGNKYANKNGIWRRKFTSMHSRSVPDQIHCHVGNVYWIEYKARGKKPTKAQLREHEKMALAGADVYVADRVEHATAIHNYYLWGTPPDKPTHLLSPVYAEINFTSPPVSSASDQSHHHSHASDGVGGDGVR